MTPIQKLIELAELPGTTDLSPESDLWQLRAAQIVDALMAAREDLKALEWKYFPGEQPEVEDLYLVSLNDRDWVDVAYWTPSRQRWAMGGIVDLTNEVYAYRPLPVKAPQG